MNPREIASSLICPNCSSVINTLGDMTPGHSGQVKKGLIVCCLNCASASIVGDSGLNPITPEKFKELDARTQSALKITLDGLRQMKGGGFSGGFQPN